VRLFRAFRQEHTDGDTFYRVLAADSAEQLAAFTPLRDRLLLDVGGGPGYFADAFRAHGATYIGVDREVGVIGHNMVVGCGTRLPVRTGSVVVCYSSNVLEHVSEPRAMLAEMVRVTRPGGTVFLSFTPWWSPWGGHETSPWHFLGGDYAARRYAERHGREPKNRYGTSLFAYSVGTVLRWAAACEDATLVQAFPRYHPRWAGWIMRVPALREVACWNAVLVLRKNPLP
jgi:SAM-dependent methyltransferase